MPDLNCDWCGEKLNKQWTYHEGHLYHLNCNAERLLEDFNYNIKHNIFEVDTDPENAKIEV